MSVANPRLLPVMQTNAIGVKELEYIAFAGHQEYTHGIFRGIPREDHFRFANKYILSEVALGGIKKMRKFLAASAEIPAAGEKDFIDEIVRLFIHSCRSARVYPRELFETLLVWGEELVRLSLLNEAMEYHDEAIDLGVNSFPDLYSRTLLAKSTILNTLGRFGEAQTLLLSLAERPYLIPDRKLIPSIVFNLGHESLLKGDVAYYKRLLFRGLKHFYTNLEDRRVFVDQLRKTYRRSIYIILDGNLPPADRFLFLIHRAYFLAHDLRVLRTLGSGWLLRLVVLGYVYGLNYARRGADSFEPTIQRGDYRGGRRLTAKGSSVRKNFLVTRAMGGIGDLLMMTPGFHELKKKYPRHEIHLAIPRRYFPLFSQNEDVVLVDIESGKLDCETYKKWYNFTDCPSARVESRSAPRVRKSRIRIFASALGLNVLDLWRMDHRPRYFLSEQDVSFREDFWKARGLEGKTVIGVQLRSDEVYRDFPHMDALVRQLAKNASVLVFDGGAIEGFEGAGIVKVGGLGIRQAFALAAGCSAIVAPDSAFVHLAAALDLPCVALYGPIDGKVRTHHYPRCKYLDVRANLGCLPCWRNDRIRCKLTNMRTSVCMADISVDVIQSALNEVLTWR